MVSLAELVSVLECVIHTALWCPRLGVGGGQAAPPTPSQSRGGLVPEEEPLLQVILLSWTVKPCASARVVGSVSHSVVVCLDHFLRRDSWQRLGRGREPVPVPFAGL